MESLDSKLGDGRPDRISSRASRTATSSSMPGPGTTTLYVCILRFGGRDPLRKPY